MPAVSVIVPAYEVEAYLGEAVESALAQTFDDLEVLVVDDGSTDRTPAIASELAAVDPRVRLLRKPNGGLSSARNLALAHARGEFVALLDGDDAWEPGFLQAQVGILRARPEVDVVTGNACDVGGSRDGLPSRPWPDPRPSPDLGTIIEDEESVFIMSVFRRRIVSRIGPFDESLRSNEDYDFWLRAACAGCRFARNDRPLGRYRRRADSLSASEVRMLAGILRVYTKLRPALLDRPRELARLDAQVARFETRRLAVEARTAIEAGDFAAARTQLAALQARGGGPAIGVARVMARWTPALLSRAYALHRARLHRRQVRARAAS
ncbi:MAG TPA: glycosyltransferase family A protein [Vicinamibacterales bacterium]|nr:glycosyltransferase family A protein [Vicinamibacterales bacterium]